VPKRITQSDIAAKLGLTKATVSLALRDDRRISAPTRERVRRAAEELGYRPDPVLSALARDRWAGHEQGEGSCLIYLVDRRSPNFRQHARFQPGARAQAEHRGYRLEVFDVAAVGGPAGTARVLRNRGIRGVLIPQLAPVSEPGIQEMDTSDFTVVCLGVGWQRLPYHAVIPDTFEATLRAWAEAKARGYRRIGGALGTHVPPAVEDPIRYGASLAAQRLLPAKERLPLWTDELHNRESFLRWMKEVRPDVVIGFGHILQTWLIEAGVRVPQEVAISSVLVGPTDTRRLSGSSAMVPQLGAAGVDLLISSMHHNEWGRPERAHRLVLPVDWVEGATLPPRDR
jgi:DNA-binding LacI/PurR family transcriptional regulator